MDNYREYPSEFDLPSADPSAVDDVAAAIGTDERRMHVRAYNYWASLLNGRDFPSIEDLEPNDVQDFSSNSVLLDFTCGGDNPAVPYIGAAIRDECGLTDDTRNIADVPSRSLLSRLTDHYMQIIANRAPVGFEAEFENQRGETICYRGILMPFSSDGEAIDFIYGVINWKKGDGAAVEPQPAAVELPVLELGAGDALGDEDEYGHAPFPSIDSLDAAIAPQPVGIPDDPADAAEPAEVPETTQPVPHFSWEDGPLADEGEAPAVELDADAGLADRLWAARETAEAAKAGEGRTRVALYKALSLAYDFALAAQSSPDDYAELLEESGVKAQARAPMTPIVKLVFGVDYDKARLTEFAAALCYAERQSVETGGFQQLIEAQAGGLKALVAAERAARRPEAAKDSKGDLARQQLRTVAAIPFEEVRASDEFALVVIRRTADGLHEPVAVIEDEALVDRAIRRAI
jgi:hypothetical protein